MRFIPNKTCLDNLIIVPKRQIGDYKALTRLVNKIHRTHPGAIIYAFIATALPACSFLLLTDIKDWTILKTQVAFVYKSKADINKLLNEYWIYAPNKLLTNCLYPDDILNVKYAKMPLFEQLK